MSMPVQAPGMATAAGKLHAFEEALSREHRRLVALCFSITGDAHTADDLA